MGSLTTYARENGRYTKAGLNSDVYLVAFSDLVAVSGTTEVFSTSVTGQVSAIGLSAGTKFVKYGAVIGQNGFNEQVTYNDNGSFDVSKELTFSLANMGSVEGKKAVENLIANPVAALVQLQNKTWVVAGLNGQFLLKTSAGTVDSGSNGRVLTLGGFDIETLQIVDPTIVSSLIA